LLGGVTVVLKLHPLPQTQLQPGGTPSPLSGPLAAAALRGRGPGRVRAPLSGQAGG